MPRPSRATAHHLVENAPTATRAPSRASGFVHRRDLALRHEIGEGRQSTPRADPAQEFKPSVIAITSVEHVLMCFAARSLLRHRAAKTHVADPQGHPQTMFRAVVE